MVVVRIFLGLSPLEVGLGCKQSYTYRRDLQLFSQPPVLQRKLMFYNSHKVAVSITAGYVHAWSDKDLPTDRHTQG